MHFASLLLLYHSFVAVAVVLMQRAQKINLLKRSETLLFGIFIFDFILREQNNSGIWF